MLNSYRQTLFGPCLSNLPSSHIEIYCGSFASSIMVDSACLICLNIPGHFSLLHGSCLLIHPPYPHQGCFFGLLLYPHPTPGKPAHPLLAFLHPHESHRSLACQAPFLSCSSITLTIYWAHFLNHLTGGWS